MAEWDDSRNIYNGKAGSAWVPFYVEKEPSSIVGWWILDAPWAHPFWSQYSIYVIHLTDMEGLPPAIKFSDSMTHEVAIVAVNPDNPQIPGENTKISFLSPPNHIYQFIANSNEEAKRRIEELVEQMADGYVSPDTDHSRRFDTLFSDGISGRGR